MKHKISEMKQCATCDPDKEDIYDYIRGEALSLL